MHYYKRNLGDYAKKAGRLSMLQHGSYTLLIDACYDREQFPTMEEAIDWTWASSTAEIEAVEFVLRKFFVLEDGKYVQKRIQEELADYHAKSETNARIAAEREANRKANNTNRARTVNGPSLDNHEAPPNQEPITNNQEPIVIGDSAIASQPPKPAKRIRKTRLPDDFNITDRVREWAGERGFNRLDEHLDAFKRKAIAKGYTYASWDDAFMEAIREDWAKLKGRGQGEPAQSFYERDLQLKNAQAARFAPGIAAAKQPASFDFIEGESNVFAIEGD